MTKVGNAGAMIVFGDVAVPYPGYAPLMPERVIGHAKVELLAWKDRDIFWLTGASALADAEAA